MRQEMMGFWDAMASVGPYANSLHLAPERTTRFHHSIFTDQLLFLAPNQQCHITEGNYKEKNKKQKTNIAQKKL